MAQGASKLNIYSGTINVGTFAMTSGTVNVSTISTLPNLPQGSINVTAGTIATLGTMGTLGLVNTITTVSNVTNGSIVQTVGTVNTGTINIGTLVGKDANAAAQTGNPVGIGGTDSGGTIRTVVVDATGAMKVSGASAGTFVNISTGTLTAGTINAATAVLNSGTINVGTFVMPSGTLNVATISTLPNLPQGSINITAGTVSAGTINFGTVYKGVPAAAAGSLTAAGTITVAGSQNDAIFWDVGGTWVGTAFFEGQIGTSAFFAIPTITPLGVVGTQTTGNGDYIMAAAGLDNARLRVTYSSGTLTHNERASNFYAPLQYALGGTIGNIGMINAATISSLPNLPQGSINVTAGTIATLGTMGTLGLVNTVTTVSNITNGSIVMTLGTVATHAISAATITAGTLTNLTSGTINAATAVLNNGTINVGTFVMPSGTLTVLPNLPQGSINVTAGTVVVTAGTLTAGTLKDNLAAIGTFTITVGTLASSAAGVGRQSTLIDNTSNLYSGAIIAAQITAGSVTTANNLISFYLIRSDNGGGPIADDNAGASDASWTQINAPFMGAILVNAVGTAVQYKAVFDTAGLGHLGPKWGIGVVHNLGNNLHTTLGSHSITYTQYNARF